MTPTTFDQLVQAHLDDTLDQEGTRLLERALAEDRWRDRFIELATQSALLRELVGAAPPRPLQRRGPGTAWIAAAAAAGVCLLLLPFLSLLPPGAVSASSSVSHVASSVASSSVDGSGSASASSALSSSAASSSAASSSGPSWSHAAVVRVVGVAPLRVRLIEALEGQLPAELTLEGPAPEGVALEAQLRVNLRRGEGKAWVLVSWTPR